MTTREIFKINLNNFIARSGKNKKTISEEMGIPYTTLTDWANGNKFPRAGGIEQLANYFNILKSDLLEESLEYLYDYDNIIPLPKTKKIPLLGTIACGEPILAVENIEDNISIPENINADFALRCKGNSMTEVRINDGDIVYIRQQSTVNNGEIAAVLIEDEATLKKVYLSEGTIKLIACNSSYEPFIYTGEELNRIRILGKAVGFTSRL